MSDITKCKGDNCPNKENCYRYTAASDEFRQVYFLNTPYKKGEECEYFWKNSEPKNKW